MGLHFIGRKVVNEFWDFTWKSLFLCTSVFLFENWQNQFIYWNLFIIYSFCSSIKFQWMSYCQPAAILNVCACILSPSVVPNSVTSGTVALQASLSMGFSRQENWGGLPFSSSRGSSWSRDRILSPRPLHWQVDSLPPHHLGNTDYLSKCYKIQVYFVGDNDMNFFFCRIKTYLIEYRQVVDRWFTK